MSKLKVKQIQLVTYILGGIACLLLGVLGFRFLGDYLTARASDTAPKNVAITDITQSSAMVRWDTDTENQVVIEYGTTPTSLTFFAPEATRTKQHKVELNLLTNATTYYFQIKAGDKVFDNGGVPWTFTTLDESAQPSPKASQPQATEKVDISTTTTSTPTSTPSPTIDPLTVEKDTKCDINEYKNRFYTDAPEYDQDSNDVVNLRDWSLCNAKNNSDETTPTLTPTNTPTPTEEAD